MAPGLNPWEMVIGALTGSLGGTGRRIGAVSK
jgi:hypothetical protein